MRYIDLNCDMGERHPLDGGQLDQAIMPYISSCNIACGGHAGDAVSMLYTVQLATKYQVNIGAHPSFPDRKNFGRVRMDISNTALAERLYQQMTALRTIAEQAGNNITYVKPHGALYNLAADELATAILICETIARTDASWALLGLADSAMGIAAQQVGIPFRREAFVDRRYDSTKRLRSRLKPGAVLDEEAGMEQLQLLITKHQVISYEGLPISIHADSICLHSDTPSAVERVRSISNYLKQHDIEVRPIS